MCKNNDYTISSEAKEQIKQQLEEKTTHKEGDFSNGRLVRNMYEDFILNQARRVSKITSPNKQELQEITIEDVTKLSKI